VAVEFRIGRRRHRLLLAGAIVALLVAGSALAVGGHAFDWFTVSEAPQQVPPIVLGQISFVKGDRLHVPGRRDQRLAQPLLAPLLGTDALVAVSSPDGRYVAYHSWQGKTPLLRVHDLRDGSDRLLARGAQTVAWGADGKVAYFQAEHPRYSTGPYLGHIVVRSLTTPPRRWTRRAGGYQAVAWARGRLLIGVSRCVFPQCAHDPESGIYVLAPDGRLSRLPLNGISAMSPEGRYAIGPYLPVAGQDSPSPFVRLVDIARRRVLTTIDLPKLARAAGYPSTAFASGIQQAAWRGNEIAATSSFADSSAIGFLRVKDTSLQIDDVLQLPPTTLPARYGPFLGAPSFLGHRTDRIVVAVNGAGAGNGVVTAVFSCERHTRSCFRGARLRQRQWFATVENPSRPRG
jgi:hypothetical protein